MKFCIEWCSVKDFKVSRHQNFEVLGSGSPGFRHISKFWGPGFPGSRYISKSWGPRFPESCGISKFWCPGFPESHGKKDVQGPRSIKVPDLGLSEPRISDLFGTLAQVWLPHLPVSRCEPPLKWPHWSSFIRRLTTIVKTHLDNIGWDYRNAWSSKLHDNDEK